MSIPIFQNQIFGNPNGFLDMTLEILAQTTVNTPLPIEMVFTDGNMLLSQRDSLIVITKLYKDGYVDKVNTITGVPRVISKISLQGQVVLSIAHLPRLKSKHLNLISMSYCISKSVVYVGLHEKS